jgi:hypothetical protein
VEEITSERTRYVNTLSESNEDEYINFHLIPNLTCNWSELGMCKSCHLLSNPIYGFIIAEILVSIAL